MDSARPVRRRRGASACSCRAKRSATTPAPAPPPTIDGDAVFTYGGAGDLVCRNLSDGQPRWQVNVLKLTGSSNM